MTDNQTDKAASGVRSEDAWTTSRGTPRVYHLYRDCWRLGGPTGYRPIHCRRSWAEGLLPLCPVCAKRAQTQSSSVEQ